MRPITHQTIKFWVPSPPSLNNAFVNSYGGNAGRVKSQAYKEWKLRAGTEIMGQRVKRIVGPAILDLYCGGIPRNSDISNRIKLVEDLLVELNIIEGDTIKTIVRVSATAVPDLVGMMVIVTPFHIRKMGREIWGPVMPEDTDFYHLKMP